MKTAALLLLLSCSAAPSIAGASTAGGANIEVTARTAQETFARSMNRALDRRLTRNLRLLAFSNSFERGFVTVRFKANATGRPTAIEVTRPSGSRRFDSLAVRSVRSMVIQGATAGLAPGQTVLAHIMVSSDQREIDKYRAEIARAATSATNLADALVLSVVKAG